MYLSFQGAKFGCNLLHSKTRYQNADIKGFFQHHVISIGHLKESFIFLVHLFCLPRGESKYSKLWNLNE